MTINELEQLKQESIANGLKDRISSLAIKTSDLCKTIASNPVNSKFVSEAKAILEDISVIQKELL